MFGSAVVHALSGIACNSSAATLTAHDCFPHLYQAVLTQIQEHNEREETDRLRSEIVDEDRPVYMPVYQTPVLCVAGGGPGVLDDASLNPVAYKCAAPPQPYTPEVRSLLVTLHYMAPILCPTHTYCLPITDHTRGTP